MRYKLPGQTSGPPSYTIHKSDDLCEALEALSAEPGRRPSQQSIKAAEEWTSIEDDQEVVEGIRLDCLDELIGEAADDGECGGGESTKSDGSKRQDSGDTDDELGLGDDTDCVLHHGTTAV